MEQVVGQPVGVSAEKSIIPALPGQSRCEMLDQPLWAERSQQPFSSLPVRLARVALVVLVSIATAIFAWTLYRVMSLQTPTALQIAFLVLGTVCFAGVTIGSATSLIGLIALCLRGKTDTINLERPDELPSGRTALLFPVYQEDPLEIAATIDTMCREIVAAKAGDLFDVFILSDTQTPAGRSAEREVFTQLRAACPPGVQVYFRWRFVNTGKKAGNVRDWIEHFGASYPFFVVLDADSIMTADTLLRLVAAMDANPKAGLIQTVPRLVGGTTMMARLQQFGSFCYGQTMAAGLAAWSGPGGNYWGHNAIVRTRAFAACAGLPKLPGAPPFGGEVLSHDFVEAALLRRGGWQVHMAPSLQGSYEGCPPTLTDIVVRDRRWAQGNLQHTRLLNAHGLPFLSRMHLALGAFAYLSSPIWAMTLIIGVILAFQAQHATPSYFGTEASLFPKWPVFDYRTALSLFAATLFVVHIPKLAGAAWVLRTSALRQSVGGSPRLLLSVLLESIFSTLIAPVLMLTQTSAVAGVLLGRDSGWLAQRRAGHAGSVASFLSQYRWQTVFGITGTLLCADISLAVLAWMAPVLGGLVLAAPIALITGRSIKRLPATLLMIPEEKSPPSLLISRAERQVEWRARALPDRPGAH